jgi:hypothetical protein
MTENEESLRNYEPKMGTNDKPKEKKQKDKI